MHDLVRRQELLENCGRKINTQLAEDPVQIVEIYYEDPEPFKEDLVSAQDHTIL
jgi:hypothetical protein